MGREMENKKILLVSHELSYTGAPRSLLQIAKILKDDAYYVSVWTLKQGEFAEEFRKLDIEVRLIEFPNAASEKLAQELKEFQIVIANTIFTSSFARYAQKFTKTILYIREAQNIPQLLETCLLEESDIVGVSNVVCVSEYAEEFIKNRYQRENITVIHNYVDDEFRSDIQPKKKLKKRKPKEKINFLVLGTLEPRKGQDIAISAFSQLLSKDKLEKGYLHLAGAMPEWAAVYQRNLSFDSEKRIVYHFDIRDIKELLE
ncbi:MAG: glycosyltransferase family 4 protein, partial [Lachnospiraceae bacterium]|nr:glycosyltransferase family 4 protein [Lachnospiraceae bacterium]